MNLSFRAPLLSDRSAVMSAAAMSGAVENDAAFANIYLLREKYGIELAFYAKTVLRRYSCGFRKDAYGFPLGSSPLTETIPLLAEDAARRGLPLTLTLLNQRQCEALRDAFPERFAFTGAEEYTEYIYLRENLAELRGSRYHGKRNHIAQFWRAYPDARIQPLIPENADLALHVAEQWLAARTDPLSPSLTAEMHAIREACENLAALGMSGLLLYAEGHPIGMTAVSEIAPRIFDVHFEKVVPGYSHAWPVVANEMAKCLRDADYLNREEDLGEAGMRASKASYRPDILNEKYIAVLRDGKEL